MEIKGVDISYCQAGIDYNKLKADGVKFAIVRAGFSETEDKLLKTHIDGLRRVGIPFGLYWYSYAYNMTETQKEADACVAVIKKYQLQNELSYPVFYDTVMLRKGAKDYNGGLASFVYTRPHIVSELKGDRAVITFGGVVVAAVKTSDLTLA